MRKENKYLLKLITTYGTAMHGAGRMDGLGDIDKCNQYMADQTTVLDKIIDILEKEDA